MVAMLAVVKAAATVEQLVALKVDLLVAASADSLAGKMVVEKAVWRVPAMAVPKENLRVV